MCFKFIYLHSPKVFNLLKNFTIFTENNFLLSLSELVLILEQCSHRVITCLHTDSFSFTFEDSSAHWDKPFAVQNHLSIRVWLEPGSLFVLGAIWKFFLFLGEIKNILVRFIQYFDVTWYLESALQKYQIAWHVYTSFKPRDLWTGKINNITRNNIKLFKLLPLATSKKSALVNLNRLRPSPGLLGLCLPNQIVVLIDSVEIDINECLLTSAVHPLEFVVEFSPHGFRLRRYIFTAPLLQNKCVFIGMSMVNMPL